jgi:hypothetical protein
MPSRKGWRENHKGYFVTIESRHVPEHQLGGRDTSEGPGRGSPGPEGPSPGPRGATGTRGGSRLRPQVNGGCGLGAGSARGFAEAVAPRLLA